MLDELYSPENSFQHPYAKDRVKRTGISSKDRQEGVLQVICAGLVIFVILPGEQLRLRAVDTGRHEKVNFGEYRIISLYHSLDEGGNYTESLKLFLCGRSTPFNNLIFSQHVNPKCGSDRYNDPEDE